RPSALRERLAGGLFFALAPRLERTSQPAVPDGLLPYEDIAVERIRGEGTLSATWYPAAGEPRGAVLLLHPWVSWGRSYFHRRGRIQALRAAGHAALAVDLPGFGESGPRAGLFDLDIASGLAELRRRAPSGPWHVWGVSSGGYWAHMVLSRPHDVAGAVFEDVSSHLLKWSWRTAPLGRPIYLIFRMAFPGVYRYFDLRRHAPYLRLRAVAYISGERDRGALAAETRDLAHLAGGTSLIVPGAGHLAAIKLANQMILDLALETFRKAEQAGGA
ncbi:MAG: alpha/beta hydrolase, partial [Thermoanaerobaculia bacterium]